jgi:biotin transport system substrate-specific component
MTSNNSINSLKPDAALPARTREFSALKDLTLILAFSILTGIAAEVKTGLGPVPFTLQTLAVVLSGAFLGKKNGAAAQITYLAGGLLGLPWFSSGGGLAYVFSPTFGYILGFPAAAFTAGYLMERIKTGSLAAVITAMAVSSLIIYIPGILWLTGYVGVSRALSLGFFPFLTGDCLKSVLGALIYSSKKLINS